MKIKVVLNQNIMTEDIYYIMLTNGDQLKPFFTKNMPMINNYFCNEALVGLIGEKNFDLNDEGKQDIFDVDENMINFLKGHEDAITPQAKAIEESYKLLIENFKKTDWYQGDFHERCLNRSFATNRKNYLWHHLSQYRDVVEYKGEPFDKRHFEHAFENQKVGTLLRALDEEYFFDFKV